jgi:hypothetical protein
MENCYHGLSHFTLAPEDRVSGAFKLQIVNTGQFMGGLCMRNRNLVAMDAQNRLFLGFRCFRCRHVYGALGVIPVFGHCADSRILFKPSD